MKFKITLIVFLFTLQVNGFAQDNRLESSIPEQAGMSSEALKRIQPLMQKYVTENKLPGMLTMVARHGKIVDSEVFGMMDKDKPMQPDAIFRIASMTKPITSVAVMMLYEEGRFNLNDPVSKYIPEFGSLNVFSSIDEKGTHVVDIQNPMTIAELLLHTSGLASGGPDTPVDSMYREAKLSDGTLKDMIQKLAKIPLLYQPGTHWNYGRSTDVLAYLVEVISGKPFDVFLKVRILDPLKMKDTDYYVPETKLGRVASVYCPDEVNGIKIIHPDDRALSIPATFFSGNGGLFSTVSDYMKFAQMLLNKGEYKGIRLLKPETVELMTSNHLTNEKMPDDPFFESMLAGMGFGYGFAVVQDTLIGGKTGSKGSYWWAGTANTYFFIDPEKDLILIFMTQFVPNYYYPVFKEFRDLVYETVIN